MHTDTSGPALALPHRYATRPKALLLLLVLMTLVSNAHLHGGDWPTHRADLRRSGISDEAIDTRTLVPAWTWRSSVPVRSAWPSPARWDAYAALSGMKSMRNYDPVIHVTAVRDQEGDGIFLAGPTDDTVRRLDADTGLELWRFTADAPVRIAPTWHEGRLFFGSDDGHAYAVDARDGSLIWKRAAMPQATPIINNGRIVSPWPIRTGVHVADDVAYFAASFLPWEPTLVCAVDASTGESNDDDHYIREVGTGWTMEGPLLISERSLIVPQGRVAPIIIDRTSGAPKGPLAGGGGSFVLLTDEDDVLHGPGNKAGWITDSDGETREQVASYQKGNAMVVEGETAWMLSDRILTSMDRPSRTLLWSSPTSSPLELIKVGDQLIAGGENRVSAFDAGTGVLLWEAEVEGDAYGLAAANGLLLVSTDEGVIHAFRGDPDRVGEDPVVTDTVVQETNAALPPIRSITDRSLVDRWVFRKDRLKRVPVSEEDPRLYPVVPNEVAGRPVARFRSFNEWIDTPMGPFVELDGASNDLEVTGPGAEPELPLVDFTLLAVARIDEPRNWGGLLGAVQDNGADETGWVLGYRGMTPGFGLRSAGPDESMSWVMAPGPVEAGRWNVIAVTYDGRRMTLYMNGEAVASSETERGPAVMPEAFWYALGAYRDDNEYFITRGGLAEIRVHDRVLPAPVIKRATRQWQALIDLPAPAEEVLIAEEDVPLEGPIFSFVAPGTARATWTTATPAPTRLSWSLGDREVGRHEEATLRTRHEAIIDGLHRNRIHDVRFACSADPDAPLGKAFQLDSSFDFTRAPVPEGAASARAEEALARTGIDRGLALVVEPDDATLPMDLARRSALNVQVLTELPDAVRRLRAELIDAGVYGERITVRLIDAPTDLGVPPGSINLLLSESGRLTNETMLEALVPGQGVGLDGDRLVRAPMTPGAGVWTHMYGTTDNSGYGGEHLSGAQSNDRLALQWIGRPGPRYQSDRGNRKPSPLAVAGRLHMQGLNRVISVDAHNGSILWALELPEVQRFNIPRDTSNWCADERNVYIAGRRLLCIDGATGAIIREQPVPDLEGRRDDHEWGYVGRAGRHLVGSAVRSGSSHTGWWGSEHWYDGLDNFSILKVCSDSLFSTDPDSGSLRWSYTPKSLIINPTITIADDAVVFLESRNTELIGEESRRIEDARLWSDLEMVALDQETGEELWRREATPMAGRVAVYTAVSDGILYLQTSADGAFALYAFDLATGRSLWRHKFDWEVDHHGKHLSRIAVAEGLLYLRPYVLDARSGEVLQQSFPAGHQCGNYACTRDSLFLRAGDLTMWSPRTDDVTKWQRVRPDCWISTVPANGMLLSPEGGGGCSCGSWIESSMAFRPVMTGPPGSGLRPVDQEGDAE